MFISSTIGIFGHRSPTADRYDRRITSFCLKVMNISITLLFHHISNDILYLIAHCGGNDDDRNGIWKYFWSKLVKDYFIAFYVS